MKAAELFLRAGILVSLLAGCATGPAESPQKSNTLAGNDQLPWAEIGGLFTPDQRRKISHLKYTGYVVMTGEVDGDNKVRVGKIIESWPDHSRDQLARTFGTGVIVHASSTGSHVPPQADVWVIFYEKMWEGNLAVIFAREIDRPTSGSTKNAMSLDTLIY
jgi:hypothetical protein